MKLLSHAATVFPVSNMQQSLDYYRDILGFEVTFSWGDPVSYSVLKRDENIQIHLVLSEHSVMVNKHHNSLYVFSYDIDALYAELQSKGAKIIQAIGDRDYGMRDFDVEDPDGHIIAFGQGTGAI